MLHEDPAKRITADEVLKHPWCTGGTADDPFWHVGASGGGAVAAPPIPPKSDDGDDTAASSADGAATLMDKMSIDDAA